MKNPKLARRGINTLIAGAFATTMAAAALSPAHAMATAADKEKCYGVAKAGMNDCASSDGKHSCAAQAPDDRMGTEWISLPKGICAKLAGGSLDPNEVNIPAADGPAHEAEHSEEHAH